MRLTVGVSDMKVSNDPDATIITFSLGSCIGVVIFDPVAKAGGILHYMLPETDLDVHPTRKTPHMYANTGIPSLFNAAYELGCIKKRMKVAVIGGSQILDQKGFFNIGKKNHLALRKMFFRNNVLIDYEDVGGNVNRTVTLEIKTGDIYNKISGYGVVKI